MPTSALALDAERLLEQIRSLGAIGTDGVVGGRTRIALTNDEGQIFHQLKADPW